MKQTNVFTYGAIFLISFFPACVLAASGNSDVTMAGKPNNNILDKSQQLISQNIIVLSENIDHFFGGDRMLDESKGSYGCVRLGLRFLEGGEQEWEKKVCLKLSLPNTKNRLKLVISDREQHDDFSDLSTGNEAVSTLATEDAGVSAAIRYISKENVFDRISTDVGVKAKIPLDPFVRIRGRRIWILQQWLSRLTEEMYWFDSKGAGLLSRIDFENELLRDWFFRSTSEADFRDSESSFRLRQNIGVFQKIGLHDGISYDFTILGRTRPNTHVSDYIFSIRLRKNMFRNWFFVEITPQIAFPREQGFQDVPSINFSMEALFGDF